MKREYLIWVILFLGGIWSAQLIGKEYFFTYGYFNPYHLKRFVASEIDYVDLFWNLLWTRGKQFVALWILRMTPWKRGLPMILKMLFIFLIGFILMVCCMTVGATGVMVLLAALFPHGICYFVAVIGLLGNDQSMSWDQAKRGISIARKIGLCTLFVVSGCILETIIGTRILRYVLEASRL